MNEQTCNLTNFFNLPLELKFHIISYLDLKSHINIRKVNKDLRLLSNLYWRGELKKIVLKDYAMQALKISTEVYVANDYETHFWNCLLGFLRVEKIKTLKNLTKFPLKYILLTFYETMDEIPTYDRYNDQVPYHEFPQYLRSLYVMQLLHLLKCFPTAQLSVHPSKIGLHLHVEIEDVWFGTLFERIAVHKLNFILVALAELYYSYCSQRIYFADFWNHLHKGGFCFTYGCELKERKRHFRTEFDISIECTEQLKSYIEAWLSSPNDFLDFPRFIFMEYFRFSLKIEVKGFVKSFYPRKILLELK